MIKKNLHDILSQPTSHNTGMKRVLIANEETDSKITQIAITELNKGATIEEHVHPDMDEYFYVMQCEPKNSHPHSNDKYADEVVMAISIDGTSQKCIKDDIIYIPAGSLHKMEVFSDVTIMTIGVER